MSDHRRTPDRYTARLAGTAGSLAALYLLPGAAQGAIIEVSGSPLTISLADPQGTEVFWDVDSAGGTDFRLSRTDLGAGATNVRLIAIDSAGYNGRGFVAFFSNTFTVTRLPVSFVVRPDPTPYYWGSGSTRRDMMISVSAPGTSTRSLLDFYYVGEGKSFIGFRFLNGTDMLYGWAEIELDLTAGTVSILRWAYNDTPDGGIHITGNVPEPSTPALTLLAMGAAGVASWRERKRRRKAAAAA